jgi:hypothetical protein
MSHAILAKLFNVNKEDVKKRTRLFYRICVPTRLALAYIASKTLQNAVWLYAALFFAVASGFLNNYTHQKESDRGAFHGFVWWKRDVHAFIYFAAAVVVVYGELQDRDVAKLLFGVLIADVAFGALHRCHIDLDNNLDIEEREAMVAVQTRAQAPFKLRF